MTTYAFPSITPNEMDVQLVSNTAIFQSPLTGAIQTLDRGGERIQVTMTFRALRSESSNLGAITKASWRHFMTAFIAKLNGRQHRFTLPYFPINNLGAWSGSPVVDGANQTGNSLLIDVPSTTVVPYGVAGDWFSVNGELKIVTASFNVVADAGTVTFAPRLRASPPNSTALISSSPSGTFILLDDPVWTNYPGPNGPRSDLTITAIEDIS